MADERREDVPDVRLLQSQDLPRDDFPGGKGELFRVYFTPGVHEAVWKHASEDTSVEICGVLVGTWQRDGVGPFVRITESIRGQAAESKFAEVTFTHETWARINAEMDTKYAKLSIVGWYHTHPDFGVFLSDRDRFIQEHFFSSPGQVAYVVDPVRKTEGVFVWRDSKPTLGEHFWVGDRVVTGTAAGAEERPASGPPSTATARPGASAGDPPPGSFLPPPGRLLAYLAVFLLGYLLAGMRSSWEQRSIAEGAVAHFGIWKGLRPGLREELDLLARDLAAISKGTELLEAGSRPGGDKDAKRPAVTWGDLRAALASTATRVGVLKATYGYTDEEQDAVRYVLRKVEEISAGGRAPAPKGSEGASPEATGTATKAAPKPEAAK
jgi:proteasome lid subunit RPN8/RPN11